jgi:hypothetical protein
MSKEYINTLSIDLTWRGGANGGKCGKMSEIINLRTVSKQKKRQMQARKAAENAAKHGRTKAEKKAELAASKAAARRLDGHKRTDS